MLLKGWCWKSLVITWTRQRASDGHILPMHIMFDNLAVESRDEGSGLGLALNDLKMIGNKIREDGQFIKSF